MKMKLLELPGRWATLLMVLSVNLITAGAFAQVRISGKVTGKGGAAIETASVFVKGTTSGIATDNAGLYSFTANLKPGKYTVVFSSTGFTTKETIITVTSATKNYSVEGRIFWSQFQEAVVNDIITR